VNQQISDEELLEDLKRVAEEIGESPTVRQYTEHGDYSVPTFQSRFGSWNDAKQQADLSNSQASRASDEELLEDLKRVAEKVDDSLTYQEYQDLGDHSAGSIQYRFGSWNQAKKEAGLDPNTETKSKATIEEILDYLKDGNTFREVAEKFGYSSATWVGKKLKQNGYKVRSRLSKNEAAYSGDRFAGMMNIPWTVLDELGISTVEEAYYDIEPFQEDGEKGVRITFHDSRVKEIKEGGENPE